MQEIKVSDLIPHPKNSCFFDDMEGEKWNEFLESIKTSGVIEPIIITQNRVIVSGHQRIRACKELGIESVWCEMRDYKNDDAIIKDLLETNIRQRGDVGGSMRKQGLRNRELERLYGIRNGSANAKGVNQYSGDTNNSDDQITQQDLARQNNQSVDTWNNAKKLAEAIPELDEFIKTGIITTTTAVAIAKRLSTTEQEELLQSLPTAQKLTQKQVQEYIDKLQSSENIITGYKTKLSQNESDIKLLKNRISELVQAGTKTEIITQEVDKPDTLNRIKTLEAELEKKTEYGKKMYAEMIDKTKKLNVAMGESTNWNLTSHCSEITKKMLDFIAEMGKYDYLAESFNEIPMFTRKEYIRCIGAVRRWADNIITATEQSKNLNNNSDYVIVDENELQSCG